MLLDNSRRGYGSTALETLDTSEALGGGNNRDTVRNIANLRLPIVGTDGEWFSWCRIS